MLLKTGVAKQDPFTAVTQFAVMELAGGRMAEVAFANY